MWPGRPVVFDAEWSTDDEADDPDPKTIEG
jgi:hypothetical protein